MADDATIEATVEAGSAAVSAGAVESGVQSLRTAARLADGADATRLRVSSRLVLAETLVHALGGLDEEGLATLYEADEIAMAHGLLNEVAQARAELGYVDFLRGRYDRAEHWLTDALEYASGSLSIQAKVMTYLGSVESDRASYRRAVGHLEQAGRRHDHPETAAWVETLRTLASRSGMRELTLRSLQHGAALGRAGDSTAAAVLADELAEYR